MLKIVKLCDFNKDKLVGSFSELFVNARTLIIIRL